MIIHLVVWPSETYSRNGYPCITLYPMQAATNGGSHMKGSRQKIKEFEDELDAELAAKGIFSYDPSRVIVDSARAISMASSTSFPSDDAALSILANISRGFDVA